jgi:SAM-dependent methyltransferase
MDSDFMLRRIIGKSRALIGRRATQHATSARSESNRWLRIHCADVKGDVLSIGSGADSDEGGSHYRSYFASAKSYTTSEVTPGFPTDLVLDVRRMPEVADGAYDCIFCSGVLEHVDDYRAGLAELTRILKPGGVLLLGLPFRQAIHLAPHDYWRFTEYGIKYLLADTYELLELAAIDAAREPGFAAAYWVKARKRAVA